MAYMTFLVLLSFAATVLGGVVPSYGGHGHEFQGYSNGIEDYGHYSHYAASLPAYSTVSYVMANGHSKPISYSGFTNHGRGHHDPGYSVQYRSEGFHSGHHNLHY